MNDCVIMKNCNADQHLTGEKKNFKHDEKKGRLEKKSTSSVMNLSVVCIYGEL